MKIINLIIIKKNHMLLYEWKMNIQFMKLLRKKN